MWRYAIGRVQAPEVAEDLIQQTLLGAIENAHTFRGDCSERTWLLSILRRRIVDHIRGQSRQRGRTGPFAPPRGGIVDPLRGMFTDRGRWRFDPGPGPTSAALDSPEFLADFERCLAMLPGPLAETFVLREVRASSAEALCAALGISPENLWVRMHRARLLLRKCLKKRWAPEGRGKSAC
jgi:RNA polymerase sigma factor (sigma-70 family)